MTTHDDCDHGAGPYHPPCPTCDGEGWRWAGYEEQRKCRDCGGSGRSPWLLCFGCDGTLVQPGEDDDGNEPPRPRFAEAKIADVGLAAAWVVEAACRAVAS